MRSVRRALAAAVAVVFGLVGCAAPPAGAPPRAPAVSVGEETAGSFDPALQRFEQTQRARAEAAEAEGRLAEAALAFEVLALVQPDDPRHAERRDRLRERITGLAAQRMAEAEAAQRRGEWDSAARLALEVLALDPTHPAAAGALRAIERERNRRSIVGRFSRDVLTRRIASEAEAGAGADSRNQLEHATLLARQGDLEAAITLLRDGSRGNGDPARKALLADLYVQRAESLRTKSPQLARTSLESALALDPNHAGARALARELIPPRRGGR